MSADVLDTPDASRGELVLYQAPDGAVELQLRLEHESLWLSQRQMALLFDKDSDTIGLHLRNIYAEGELAEAATTEDSSVVQIEGKRQVRRRVRLYNLDAVISVGYRVSSRRGTQFRIWATHVLRDHLVKGYTVNAARLGDLNQALPAGEEPCLRRRQQAHRGGTLPVVPRAQRRAPPCRRLSAHLSDAALVALTLMIAESRPQEKDVLVRIAMHLLVGGEQP